MPPQNKPLCTAQGNTSGILIAGLLRRPLAWVEEAAERQRQRRALRRMDAVQLKDIGLTPDDVDQEAYRPFWR